jgi:membrane-bound lytic murein transglycosylase A
MKAIQFTLCIFMLSLLAACGTTVDTEKAALVLKPADFDDLPGWENDQHDGTLLAMGKSCERILKKDNFATFGPDGIGGYYENWHAPCQALLNNQHNGAREFFETWFTPYKATFDGREDEGLFTGYFEPTLDGSLSRHGPYQYPLRRKPDGLVMVDLGQFRDDLKGRRIAGTVKDGKLKPFEDRAEIMLQTDNLSSTLGEPLVWVDDPVDAFFLHIQGSGRVNLDSGGFMRVGYDGQNGHPYFAVGRELINRGALDKETVSLQSIRDWMYNNPGEAYDLMSMNKSYVFFRELNGEGPLGAEGIELTPERSLAVDSSRMPYGAPVWVDIDRPVDEEDDIQRMLIAQDTGGAIRGAVRGDVFWGHGDRAAKMAGHMKSQGRMWLLLPKSL